MKLNPAIVGAILVQIVVARFNRIAGAIIGFLVTTGVLIWGLGIYSDGKLIALFNFELSKTTFIIGCAAWYFFDAIELLQAWRTHGKNASPAEEPTDGPP